MEREREEAQGRPLYRPILERTWDRTETEVESPTSPEPQCARPKRRTEGWTDQAGSYVEGSQLEKGRDGGEEAGMVSGYRETHTHLAKTSPEPQVRTTGRGDQSEFDSWHPIGCPKPARSYF